MHYIILHGTGCTPHQYRLPRLRQLLEDRGHTVCIPALPNAEKPDRKTWRDAVLTNYVLDEGTVLIGHSAGATAILSVLESGEQPIAKAILVAGFYIPLEKAGRTRLMLQDDYDRQKIAQHAKEIILINADNDPWGCTDVQARPVAERLGATFVFAEGMGHMGSEAFDDPCGELPLLIPYV